MHEHPRIYPSAARIDPWMFVHIDVMKDDGTYGRRGGSRSDDMKTLFKRYLPHFENLSIARGRAQICGAFTSCWERGAIG